MYANHISPVALENQDRFCKALFTLMPKKDFERITITEICRMAEMERMTFYRHFEEKMDVVDYYLDHQMLLLMQRLPSHATLMEGLTALFGWTYEERQNLIVLIEGHLVERISQSLVSSLFAGLTPDPRRSGSYILYGGPGVAAPDPFLINAVMGIYYGIFSAWRASGFQAAPERVAAEMASFLGADNRTEKLLQYA